MATTGELLQQIVDAIDENSADHEFYPHLVFASLPYGWLNECRQALSVDQEETA